MKIDHHEFRLAMGMFRLTPDEINAFAKWLIVQGHEIREFMNLEADIKRTKFSEFNGAILSKAVNKIAENQLTN